MKITRLKADRKLLITAVLVFLGPVSILYWRDQILEIALMIRDRNAIFESLNDFGYSGPAILFIILALQVFLTVIPGHAFMVACGYIYGLLIGSIITQSSTVIASQPTFLLARKYGRPFVDHIATANIIEKWNGGRNPGRSFLLFFFYPTDFSKRPDVFYFWFECDFFQKILPGKFLRSIAMCHFYCPGWIPRF